MINVISEIAAAVHDKYPHTHTSYVLSSKGLKAEIIEGIEAVIYVQRKFPTKEAELLGNRENTLKAVQAAFPNVTNVRIKGGDEADAVFAEEIAAEEAEDAKREAEAAAREAEYDKQQRIIQQNTLIKYSNLPINTKNTHRFDTFKVLDGTREGYRLAREFAFDAIGDESGDYDYENLGRHHFLTFIGDTGRGKTHLAFAIGWESIEHGDDVRYYQIESLLDTLRSSYGTPQNRNYTHNFDDSGAYDKIMKTLKEVSVLILDDLGAQKRSEWETAKLDELIDYRYVNEMDTVFTTNLELKHLTPRIASRLSEGNVIKLTTPADYRQVKAIQREKKLRKVANNEQ